MALRVSAASARPVKPLDDDVPRFNYRPRPAARLTQAEKAAESRRRVLDAALSCLIDRGYSNTSTQEIASRAGLSRGSQLYHFPKKDALLTGAVEYLIELRIAEFQETVARLPKGADLWTAAIAAFWDAWNGPLFFAWLELAVAARTDPALRKSVGALNKRTNDYLHRALHRSSSRCRKFASASNCSRGRSSSFSARWRSSAVSASSIAWPTSCK